MTILLIFLQKMIGRGDYEDSRDSDHEQSGQPYSDYQDLLNLDESLDDSQSIDLDHTNGSSEFELKRHAQESDPEDSTWSLPKETQQQNSDESAKSQESDSESGQEEPSSTSSKGDSLKTKKKRTPLLIDLSTSSEDEDIPDFEDIPDLPSGQVLISNIYIPFCFKNFNYNPCSFHF